MKLCPNFGCDNTGSYAVQLSEDECGQEQCQFCYCEPDSVFNVTSQAVRQSYNQALEDAMAQFIGAGHYSTPTIVQVIKDLRKVTG